METQEYEKSSNVQNRLGEARMCSENDFCMMLGGMIYLTMFDNGWKLNVETVEYRCENECDLRHSVTYMTLQKGDKVIDVCGARSTAFDDIETAMGMYLQANPIQAIGALLGDEKEMSELREKCDDMLGVTEFYITNEGCQAVNDLLGAFKHSVGKA